VVKSRLTSYYYLVQSVTLRKGPGFVTIIIPAMLSVRKHNSQLASLVQVSSPVLLNFQAWLKKVHDLGVISIRNVWKIEERASSVV